MSTNIRLGTLRRLFDQAVAKWGQVDVLVNNAGITRDALVLTMKAEQWNDVINTNLSGVFFATQVQIPAFGINYSPASCG
jgi:3-oxoacyl-[acyl-carrier protein] reductase